VHFRSRSELIEGPAETGGALDVLSVRGSCVHSRNNCREARRKQGLADEVLRRDDVLDAVSVVDSPCIGVAESMDEHGHARGWWRGCAWLGMKRIRRGWRGELDFVDEVVVPREGETSQFSHILVRIFVSLAVKLGWAGNQCVP